MSANMHSDFGGGKMDDFMTDATATGLLSGNQVLTMAGYTRIEDLKAGDRVITRNGARVLQDVTATTTIMRPIKVGSNTLGFSRPNAEMLLAPGQEVMVRDWRAEMLFGADFVIMPIDRMVDGKYIAQAEDEAEHTSYELCFEEEEIFYADGVEVVSTTALAKTGKPEVPAAA